MKAQAQATVITIDNILEVLEAKNEFPISGDDWSPELAEIIDNSGVVLEDVIDFDDMKLSDLVEYAIGMPRKCQGCVAQYACAIEENTTGRNYCSCSDY